MSRILALNAYHGGSHSAFLQGWIRRSRHAFSLLTLPPYKWKWRMRHAAVTFAEQLAKQEETWDALFCTDMLNLAEFRGLCPPHVRRLPTIVYFHENQLTYPNRREQPRDLHYAFTNLTTALAADRVWFNSEFHRQEFLTALGAYLKRMPDYRPLDAVSRIREKSEIQPPGIEPFPEPAQKSEDDLHIVWAARWEHDKNPETFFQALKIVQAARRSFTVSVLGESFANSPDCFAAARQWLGGAVKHWGYLPDRQAYRRVLSEADVVVSTAIHEFFGIAILEAAAAGCFPLAPRRLAYPEVLGAHFPGLYDGSAEELAARLLERIDGGAAPDREFAETIERRYGWPRRASALDNAAESVK